METIELQMQLWGDSDIKQYAEKEGHGKILRKNNIGKCV